jgi:hypothetical protein
VTGGASLAVDLSMLIRQMGPLSRLVGVDESVEWPPVGQRSMPVEEHGNHGDEEGQGSN